MPFGGFTAPTVSAFGTFPPPVSPGAMVRDLSAEPDRVATPGRKIHPLYNDSSADTELVSSDGTIFRVMRYHLQSASPSFREALDRWDAGFGLKRITLNDATSDFEGEETVLTFLDLVNGSSLPCEANADVQIEKLSRLISFCDKWHAKSVANLAWEHLSRLATQKTSSGRALNYLPIFALASRWKRLDICAQLIRAGVPRNDEIVPELPPEHGRPAAEDVNLHDRGDSYVLDPAGMPYTRVKKIHSEYAWALGVLFQGLAVEQTRKMEAQLGELRRDDDTSCSRCPDCAARQFGVIQRDSAKIDWYQIAESFEGLIKGTMDSSSA